MQLTEQQQADIAEWARVNGELAYLKARESALRDRLFAGLFDQATKGTQNLEIANGWKLRAVRRMEYAFKSEDKQDITDVLSMLPDDVAARIAKTKYSLVKDEYDALTPELRQVVDMVVESKWTKPTLELVAPKGSA